MTAISTIFVVVLFAQVAEALFGMGRMQSVGATGRLICNGLPAPAVRVKLYDTEILFDHQLAITYSNPMGIFQLSGHKREFTSIDPRLYIYHRCNYDGPCLKKSEIDIPRNFIYDGKTPLLLANLGAIDLNGRFTHDSVDCIN